MTLNQKLRCGSLFGSAEKLSFLLRTLFRNFWSGEILFHFMLGTARAKSPVLKFIVFLLRTDFLDETRLLTEVVPLLS